MRSDLVGLILPVHLRQSLLADADYIARRDALLARLAAARAEMESEREQERIASAAAEAARERKWREMTGEERHDVVSIERRRRFA